MARILLAVARTFVTRPARRRRIRPAAGLAAGGSLPAVEQSDNLMHVSEITATEAARSFADLLDAVEHRGESFTIVRRGKAIASLAPMDQGHGTDVKALLRRHRPDSDWPKDLALIRSVVQIEERP